MNLLLRSGIRLLFLVPLLLPLRLSAAEGLGLGDGTQNFPPPETADLREEETAPERPLSGADGPDGLGRESPAPPLARHLAGADPNPTGLAVGREIRPLHRLVTRFYEARGYVTAWYSPEAGVGVEAERLLGSIPFAPTEGLDPEDYDAPGLESRLRRAEAVFRRGGGAGKPLAPADAEALLGFDHAFTHTFFLIARHVSGGRVDTSEVRLGWETAHRVIDYPAVLERALSTGRVAEELGDLAPPHPDYHRLAAALAGQRRLAERPPLPEVAPGPTLRPERDPDPIRVLALELRLQTEGYLDDLASDGLLTERIGEAVKAYQADHGLVVDGYAGRFTIAMMNATPAQRIRQIEANMERWRWMPEDLGARHVRVNTPSFQLELYENGSPDTSMRIIVGRDEWETPVFSDSVRTLVVNPTWNVPKKVAVRTVVQKILADSSYLASNDFDVLSDWGRNAVPVSPDSIDWTAYTERTFPFRLRQNPGPANALGRMKFLFPNKYAIYLHDTPDRRAFHKWVRQLSHGCIRIEEPELLADFVFAADSSWSRQKLGRALRAKKPRYFSPPRPVPIHILYFTSVAGENGETRFFGDVYGVDTDVLAALDRRRAIRDKRRGAAP